MPSTIVLYNFLGEADTTGTWSQISIPSGASGPAAPGTYNGTINFSGEPAGQYVYRYTSGVSTADVTVNWNPLSSRQNDTCAGAQGYGVPGSVPFTVTNNEYLTNAEDCSRSLSAPTDSGDTKPALWGAGPFGGEDIWFLTYTPAQASAYVISVTVDGSVYGDEGLVNPCIELYTGSTTDTCSTKTTAAYLASPPGVEQTQDVSVTVGPTAGLLWIRVASYTAGKFDLILSAT